MQDRINFRTNEVALGGDLNLVQQLTGNTFSRILQGMLWNANEAAVTAAVLGGFYVTIPDPRTSWIISMGAALQSTGLTGLEVGDYPFELLQSPLSLAVPATAPPATGFRIDVIEMKVQARTSVNALRSFYDPATGTVASQLTPKGILSLPEFRARTGVTGGNLIDPDWIPLAAAKVYLNAGVPTHEIVDMRPMFRQRGYMSSQAVLDGEITAPGNALTTLGFSRGYVHFDGRLWALPDNNTLISSMLEGGYTPTVSPASQLFHLYVVKPKIPGFSPDYVQYILSNKSPTAAGAPSSAVQMNGIALGHVTTNAAYICSMVLQTVDSGGGVLVTTAVPFRRGADGLTLIGENAAYTHAATCPAGVPIRYSTTLPLVPANATSVRLAITLDNAVGYTLVTRMGFVVDNGNPANNFCFQKFGVSASSADYHPLIVDVPLNRPSSGDPYIIITADAVFQIDFDVLGWTHTPNASIAG